MSVLMLVFFECLHDIMVVSMREGMNLHAFTHKGAVCKMYILCTEHKHLYEHNIPI